MSAHTDAAVANRKADILQALAEYEDLKDSVQIPSSPGLHYLNALMRKAGFRELTQSELTATLAALIAEKQVVEWRINNHIIYLLPGSTLTVNGVPVELPG